MGTKKNKRNAMMGGTGPIDPSTVNPELTAPVNGAGPNASPVISAVTTPVNGAGPNASQIAGPNIADTLMKQYELLSEEIKQLKDVPLKEILDDTVNRMIGQIEVNQKEIEKIQKEVERTYQNIQSILQKETIPPSEDSMVATILKTLSSGPYEDKEKKFKITKNNNEITIGPL